MYQPVFISNIFFFLSLFLHVANPYEMHRLPTEQGKMMMVRKMMMVVSVAWLSDNSLMEQVIFICLHYISAHWCCNRTPGDGWQMRRCCGHYRLLTATILTTVIAVFRLGTVCHYYNCLPHVRLPIHVWCTLMYRRGWQYYKQQWLYQSFLMDVICI